MDSKRRDRHEIVAEILHYAREGRLKTHIMFRARLSYHQIQEYLPLLLEKEFLSNLTIKQRKGDTTIYRTTKKGIELLEHLETASKLFP